MSSTELVTAAIALNCCACTSITAATTEGNNGVSTCRHSKCDDENERGKHFCIHRRVRTVTVDLGLEYAQ